MKKALLKKVVFVNPPMNREAQYKEYSQVGGFDPPFGLCYLAAMARKEGYASHIIDSPSLGWSFGKTISEVIRLKPDYICITATTYAINSAIKVSSSLKKKSKALRIIGGSHFSALPRETIRFFDVGVIGEGELTLVDLLKTLEERKPLSNVLGIVYKEKSKVMINKPRPLVRDLDDLPKPAFDLLPGISSCYQLPVQSAIAFPSMSLISSRGCSGHCTFCDRSISGNHIRAHSAEYLFDIIKSLVDHNKIKSLMFHDDNFLIFKERNLKLVRLLNEAGIKIKFNCLARVDFISKSYLAELKKGGLWQVNIGIESGSQRMLDFYDKNISLAQIRKSVDVIRSLGLRAKGFIILGGPSETPDDLELTRQFVNELKLTDIGMTYFTPLPGAEIYHVIDRHGRLIAGFDHFNMFEVVFIPAGLKREAIEEYYKRIYREFYLRPAIMFDYLKRIRSIRQVIYFTRGLRVFFSAILRKRPCGNRKY